MMKLISLQDEIRDVITSGELIRSFEYRIIPGFFKYKSQLLSLTLTKQDMDLATLCDQSLHRIKNDRENSRLEVLFENILFANRCHQRIVNAIATNPPIITKSKFLDALGDHYYKTFTDWVSRELRGVNAQYLLDLVHSFIFMEFVILATDIIQKENLLVTDETIRELEFLIADSAQEYLATAEILGLVKETTYPQMSNDIEFDQQDLDEQRYLADSGLMDFGSRIE